MIRYDASIIHQFAQSLYNRAQRITFAYAMYGVFMGAAVAVGLSIVAGLPAAEMWALFGAVVGVVLGLAMGSEKAFALRLQAQIALCQVQIELNSRPRQQPQQSFAQPSP